MLERLKSNDTEAGGAAVSWRASQQASQQPQATTLTHTSRVHVVPPPPPAGRFGRGGSMIHCGSFFGSLLCFASALKILLSRQIPNVEITH